MLLEIDALEISYGPDRIVQGVSLGLNPGAIGCLLGPSGCGKTTLLRAIAGFEPVCGGTIRLHDRTVSRPGMTLPTEKRHIGMVFQDLALFPHLSVLDNIAFGLKGQSKASRQQRVDELLALIGLENSARLYPHQLSGGQQQRVALARAMAPRPDLLLLDEPFSSLDQEIREKLAREVRQILKEDGLTALLVTHDQLEAFAMADEIGVIYQGKLHQWDIAYNLYHRPASQFVAGFIGEGTLLPGVVLGPDRVETALGIFQGDFTAPCSSGCQVQVLVRPEDVIHDDTFPLRAEVGRRNFRGPNILYTLRLSNGEEIQALVPSHCSHAVGERIGIRAEIHHIILFAVPSE
jgi:iron(III) transport system ATP-binding protein